jgi:hypothetical protein
MHCIGCGKHIPSDSKFCQFCGKTLPPRSAQETVGTVPISNIQDGCQVCGAHAPTKYNEFDANIGMLFARRHLSVKARMCRNCTDRFFWKFTFTNIILGPWGAISLIVAPVFLIMNTTKYLRTLSLKKYY